MELVSKTDDGMPDGPELFRVDALPRPPGAPAAFEVSAPRPRLEVTSVPPRKAATELLADWLCGYGAGEDVPPLSDGVVKAYLEPAKPAARTRSNVFASLMATPGDKGEVV